MIKNSKVFCYMFIFILTNFEITSCRDITFKTNKNQFNTKYKNYLILSAGCVLGAAILKVGQYFSEHSNKKNSNILPSSENGNPQKETDLQSQDTSNLQDNSRPVFKWESNALQEYINKQNKLLIDDLVNQAQWDPNTTEDKIKLKLDVNLLNKIEKKETDEFKNAIKSITFYERSMIEDLNVNVAIAGTILEILSNLNHHPNNTNDPDERINDTDNIINSNDLERTSLIVEVLNGWKLGFLHYIRNLIKQKYHSKEERISQYNKILDNIGGIRKNEFYYGILQRTMVQTNIPFRVEDNHHNNKNPIIYNLIFNNDPLVRTEITNKIVDVIRSWDGN